MRCWVLFILLARRWFRLLATAILILIAVAPISAQFDDLEDYTLDCNTLDIVKSDFGSYPAASYQTEAGSMEVPFGAFLDYIDAAVGGLCHERSVEEAKLLMVEAAVPLATTEPTLVFTSDTYGFEGNLPEITIPAGQYRWEMDGIARWGDESKEAEWWIYGIGDDSCWARLPDQECFGRFRLDADCTTRWTIYNRKQFPWRIEFVREGQVAQAVMTMSDTNPLDVLVPGIHYKAYLVAALAMNDGPYAAMQHDCHCSVEYRLLG